jgi:hypothetical protein
MRIDNINDQTSKQMATAAVTTPMRTDDEGNNDMIICLSARMSAVRLTDHSSKHAARIVPQQLFGGSLSSLPTGHVTITNASRKFLQHATFMINATRPFDLSPDSLSEPDSLPPKWQPCEIIEIEKKILQDKGDTKSTQGNAAFQPCLASR